MTHLSWIDVLSIVLGACAIVLCGMLGYMLTQSSGDLERTPPHFNTVRHALQGVAVILIVITIIRFL